MRRHGWFGSLFVSLALVSACSVSPGGSGFGSAEASAGSQTETDGSAESDDSTTDGGSSGPRFDVADTTTGTGGDDGGNGVAPTCDNIHEFPDTSVGCVFFAQAPNAMAPEWAPHGMGISVGNPADADAHIIIEDMRGPGGTLRTMTEFDLAPGESKMTVLNGTTPPGLFPDESYHKDSSYNDPESLGLSAFRITADVPVTATQIFPVGGAKSYTPDSSLLLPENSLGTVYAGANYDDPERGGNFFDGWAIVVGTKNGTKIETEFESFTLDAFEGRVLDTGAGMGKDQETQGVTGLYVVGDKPFALLTGNYCVMVPVGIWTCDHIEEQMVPLATWGTKYVGARHPRRSPDYVGADEPVVWRVIAGTDDVQVQLDPPVANGGVIELEKTGDWQEFQTEAPFLASSDQPFLLVEYMTGSDILEPDVMGGDIFHGSQSGDPAMAQMTAVEQWVEELPFVTDTSYDWDFVTFVREQGTEITLDCLGLVSADHFVPIGSTGYELGHVTLDEYGMGGEGSCVDGAQYMAATAPVGVVVGGVSYDASYLAPGGMKLDDLWVPPPMPPEG